MSVQQESTAVLIRLAQGLLAEALAMKLDFTAAMSTLLEASNYIHNMKLHTLDINLTQKNTMPDELKTHSNMH